MVGIQTLIVGNGGLPMLIGGWLHVLLAGEAEGLLSILEGSFCTWSQILVVLGNIIGIGGDATLQLIMRF